jgi:hypothetical protein
MKKTKVVAMLVALLVLLFAANASAQVRLEGNLAWPLTIGTSSSSTLFGGTSFDLTKYYFLVPDFRIYYQFGGGLLDGGVGLRVPTLFIVSALYPEAFVELNLKPFVLEGTLGGLLFGYFGLGVAGLSAQSLLMSDLNASFELTPWFRLGGGMYLIMPANSTFSQNFLYVGYISLRFIFLVK